MRRARRPGGPRSRSSESSRRRLGPTAPHRRPSLQCAHRFVTPRRHRARSTEGADPRCGSGDETVARGDGWSAATWVDHGSRVSANAFGLLDPQPRDPRARPRIGLRNPPTTPFQERAARACRPRTPRARRVERERDRASRVDTRSASGSLRRSRRRVASWRVGFARNAAGGGRGPRRPSDGTRRRDTSARERPWGCRA